jgi:hypothetical protein
VKDRNVLLAPRRRLAAAILAILLAVSMATAMPLAQASPGSPPAPLDQTWPQEPARAEAAALLQAPHAPGELLVKWRAASTSRGDSPDGLISALGGSIESQVPALGLARLELPEEQLLSALARLLADPSVEWVEPNYLLELALTPNDPYYAVWQGYLASKLEMESAWDHTVGDPSIVVAVIDTGIDFAHEDLREGLWTNADEVPDNGVDDDGNGYVDDVRGWDFYGDDNWPGDGHGHGTHVSGIVAARTNNRLGVAGMAGQTTIMPLAIFSPGGVGTYADLIEAILYAVDNGARVINMSLGATSYSRGEEAAVRYAWDHGVLLVAAAGNNVFNVAFYPAAHDVVIAVSSVTTSDQRSTFSNYCDFVDLSAPGSNIMSTTRGNTYGTMSGTSMATPHVAGLAALLLARNWTLTNVQVRQILEDNADDLGEAGWDPFFGHGRINGRRAMEATPDPMPPFPPPYEPPVPQPLWPAGCSELLANGDFEDVSAAPWQVTGEATPDQSVAYSGGQSLRLASLPSGSGEAWQQVAVPPDVTAATLFFAVRILSDDAGFGSDPYDAFDDHLTASFRDGDGGTLIALLRAGNTSDGAPDLPWDEYIYRLTADDLDSLRREGTVQLHFAAGNDVDDAATSFHIDAVRFCAGGMSPPLQVFVPLVWTGGG